MKISNYEKVAQLMGKLQELEQSINEIEKAAFALANANPKQISELVIKIPELVEKPEPKEELPRENFSFGPFSFMFPPSMNMEENDDDEDGILGYALRPNVLLPILEVLLRNFQAKKLETMDKLGKLGVTISEKAPRKQKTKQI